VDGRSRRGLRAAEAGQSGVRDDEATGSKQLRNIFPKHFEPEDVPLQFRASGAS